MKVLNFLHSQQKSTPASCAALLGGGVSVFSQKYVGHEDDEARRQPGDHELVDGEDVLQRVDPLLHGTGVEVVVDAGPDAPDRPHGVHHQRHGEAGEGGGGSLSSRSDGLCQRSMCHL